MLALMKASLLATFKSPQAIFFSLFFPIVLIWIFGSLGGNASPSINVALEKGIDTSNVLYLAVKHHPALHFVDDKKKNIEEELKKGRISAVINIIPVQSAGQTTYDIQLRTSTASQKDLPLLQSVLKTVANEMDRRLHPNQKPFASVTEIVSYRERPYKMIDFFSARHDRVFFNSSAVLAFLFCFIL